MKPPLNDGSLPPGLLLFSKAQAFAELGMANMAGKRGFAPASSGVYNAPEGIHRQKGEDCTMQEQIESVITRLQALLAQDGLEPPAASELRYRLRQLEMATAQLQRGDDREEAYALLCDALLALARDGVLARAPQSSGQETPRSVPLTPEQLAWARRELNEEEIIAGLREVRESGGLELKDFLPDLERAAGAHE